MSISKLFTDFRNSSRNYSEYDTEKTFFQDVESISNAVALEIKARTYVPQLDYSRPENFIKFGSAELFYKGAVNRIVDYYPYDGSEAERNEFYNNLFDGEKYIFNNLYPRTTGYAVFCANGWGTLSGGLDNGYGLPTNLEFITFKGGPHSTSNTSALSTLTNNPYNNKYQSANIYDETIYTTAGLPSDYDVGTRKSNLKSNFNTGVTVEFWLKHDGFGDGTKTAKQVVFDLWNSGTIGSNDYGRLTIELFGAISAGATSFHITAHSGSETLSSVASPIGTKTTKAFVSNGWHHYAFRFYNSGTDLVTKLYVDGKIDDTNIYSGGALGEITTTKMVGRIGALTTQVSASSPFSAAGAGKLSGSVDEFRFWKESRDGRDIGLNYFTQVGGGTNTDISNTTLGVYYKFNEGKTGNSTLDSTVLDYSGRLTNGVWTGYSAAARNTGSAIVSSSAAIKEYQDPIIYRSHPQVLSLQTTLKATGSAFDQNNNNAFLTYAPSWVVDEHDNESNENLKIISHIVGTYFDKMYLLSNDLPKFRQPVYTTASHSPTPFASHLPTSLGMYVPELFIDSTILEKLEDRNETSLLEGSLTDTKNLIYLNLYNNLTNIFKSKGTEKSIRNVMRCFYLDDQLLKLKKYNVNATYEIKDNLSQVVVDKKGINFNHPNNLGAVVYQRKDATNPESSGYIFGSVDSGSFFPESQYGFTMETDIVFPNYFTQYDTVNRNFTTVSLFGVHGVTASSAANLNGTDTTFLASDPANFQVYAVRDRPYSKNVFFKLTSSYASLPFPQLTSSDFVNVYDNTKWNLSVRLEPNWDDKNYYNATGSYKLIFRGVNDVLGTTKNSFEVSTSIANTAAKNFLRANKRAYVGATRTNLTGALINKSDAVVLNCRVWAKSIDNGSLSSHNYGSENSGITDLNKSLSPNDVNNANGDLTNQQTLALDWTFNQVTGSDSTGNFVIADASSGSAELRTNYAWLGKTTGFQHTGYGNLFLTSSALVTKQQKINSFQIIDPEQVVSDDMINILSEDDETFGTEEVVPSYLFTIEKNMYEAISSEMLTFFAGAIDFNNLIGEPVNRYRERYKDLEKLRESFFRKVTKTSDVEKFIDYYKWFDDAITTIIKQLLPASAEGLEKVLNIVESHVLERNKYKTPFPTLETKSEAPDGGISGRTEADYPYSVGFSPPPRSPRDTTIRAKYWKDRAERTSSEISSSNPIVDAHREIYRKIITSNPFLSSSLPTLYDGTNKYTVDAYARRNFIKNQVYEVNKTKIIKGGSNFDENKNIQFALTSVHPAGPVNRGNGSIYVPLNVLLSFITGLTEIPTSNDPKPANQKVKRYLKVLSGREYEDGLGYKNLKSSMAFPFSIFETTVTSGHQAHLRNRLSGTNLQITNLHNDVYGPDNEKPMQGPFTDYAVGGHQSRHVKLNTGADSTTTRPEAWRILVGTCDGIPSGAIGLVGPDYPDPGTSLVGSAAYPYRPHQKAVYYRDMVAKRPVNIRNIRMTTGSSTVLGNYSNTYEYVQSVGAFQNPRHFVDNQPTLPSEAIQNNTTSSTSVRTILDVHRTTAGHRAGVSEYSTNYLNGNTNKSIIISRFSAPGGIEVMTRGYQDIRSSEFSVYNSLSYRNLSVHKPSQGPSGTISTPATLGDTTNIQVFDIHGKDYGLRSHLARHTARFGRDSVFESTPGASYDELPGFHKVHRNCLTRKKINYALTQSIVAGTGLTNSKCIDINTSGAGNCAVINNASKRAERLFDGAYAQQNGGSVLFTFSGWLKNDLDGNGKNIFEFGYTTNLGGGTPIHRFYMDSSDKLKYEFVTTNGSAFSGGTYITNDQVMTGSGFKHVVITVSGTQGLMPSSGPTVAIYVNGESKSLNAGGATNELHSFPTSSTSGLPSKITNFRAFGEVFTAPVIFFAQADNTTSFEFTGQADEFSLYNTALNASQVSTLYNSGKPLNLTQSTTPGSSSLLSWWRMGDAPADNFTKGEGFPCINPFDAADGNVIFDIKNGANIHFTANRTTAFKVTTSSIETLPGQPPDTILEEIITGYSDDQVCDNFFIQHQIPRSSKQYSWLTASLVTDNGWVGYLPINYNVKKSDMGQTGEGFTEPYSFLSASEVGSAFGGGSRRFPLYSDNQHIPQVTYLNLNIHEPINSNTNTIGYSTDVPLTDTTEANTQYINTDLINVVGTPATAQGPAFNNLMFKRGNQYGFNSWNAFRQVDNPIFRHEKATNTITLVSKEGNDDSLVTYDLPPVSNRGRPNIINFESDDKKIYTIKATGENEKIYFNSVKMDNVYAPRLDSFSTPSEHIIQIGRSRGFKLNWVIYSQQLFPSIRNEFTTKATTKTGYDNKFWRTLRENRSKLDTTHNTTSVVGVPNGAHFAQNTLGYYVSRSAWPLDGPEDVLTRLSTPLIPNLNSFQSGTLMFSSGAAGELQNGYTYWTSGSGYNFITPSGSVVQRNGDILDMQYSASAARRVGAVYARPHVLSNPWSVKNPNSPVISGALSSLDTLQFVAITTYPESFQDDGRQIKPGGGQTLWEAGTNAGYHTKSADGTTGFVSASSEPWFNTYDDYKFDLKLMAKGFSILPEFRISENVADYIKSEEDASPYQPLELELPNVPGADTQNDGTFFISYSNSEFLKDFLNIKRESLLNASEIRLSVTGAIRFNPYKGFYPAQRTINLVEQFKDTYSNHFNGKYPFTGSTHPTAAIAPVTGTGGFFNPSATGSLGSLLPINGFQAQLRPAIQPLFAPGILYNSIKSGMAVDFPVIYNYSKAQRYDYSSAKSTNQPNKPISTGSWVLGFNTQRSDATPGDAKILFDERLPFESIINPLKHMGGKTFVDMESNPRVSLPTASVVAFSDEGADSIYNLMSRNFFGAVPSFFLKNGDLTTIKSKVNTDGFVFADNETYMMRIKMNRSTKGLRSYIAEHDQSGNFAIGAGGAVATGFSSNGATYLSGSYAACSAANSCNIAELVMPELKDAQHAIPQDPFTPYAVRLVSPGMTDDDVFQETFTMYSRPSAFGPDLSSRPTTDTEAMATLSSRLGSFDSFAGVNPAFTPPYYNGECWADVIFRPVSNKTYQIEDIIAESEIVSWRFDAGRPLKLESSDPNKPLRPALILDTTDNSARPAAPYSGLAINAHSMQLTSSLNMFGVEKVTFSQVDKFENLESTRPGQSVGQRWVIKPKFETPMLNFNKSNVTRPTSPNKFGYSQIARGMWHQFGHIPKDGEGVYITVDDIPNGWLKYHYDVRSRDTIYNNFDAANTGSAAYKKVKSLADLVGFDKGNSARLGELKKQTELREAIIAIPYITERTSQIGLSASPLTRESKRFISIPPERFEAAKVTAFGSAEGDSLDAAGASISKQLQKMQRYVLPPQFDFINNAERAVDPFVMYIFEFKYLLDRDDLSYIWQNIAPRDYKKISFQNQSVAHQLVDAEILNEDILEENENLRWMLFKVKQKGQEDYWDYVENQARGTGATEIEARTNEYTVKHNWPYDYVSFVEMAKMNVEVKFTDQAELQVTQTSLQTGAPIGQEMVVTQAVSYATPSKADLAAPYAYTIPSPMTVELQSTTLEVGGAEVAASPAETVTATVIRGPTGGSGGGY